MSEMLKEHIDNSGLYVGFWVRFGASIIDTTLLLLIVAPALLWLYGVEYFLSPHITPDLRLMLINYGLPLVLTVLFWAYKSATPGKMSLNIKIVDAISGESPTLIQSFIRYLGYYISLLPLGLGFFWVAWDKKKQGWHDKMAGTVVIKSLPQESQHELNE
jgi:uncharacterized RDD family membrane protein YckC